MDDFFIGMASAVIVIFILLTLRVLKPYTLKIMYYFSRPKCQHLMEARVATDMVPRFSSYRKKKEPTKIYIVGGDGCYANSLNGSYWLRSLRRWLKNGSTTVTYILIDPNTEAYNKLSHIADKLENFELLAIVDSALNKEDEKFVKQFLTYHPSTLSAGSTQLLWLEHDHPSGSDVANNVQFVVSEHATDDELELISNSQNDINRLEMIAQSQKMSMAA